MLMLEYELNSFYGSNFNLRWKLTVICLLTSTLALLFISSVFLIYEITKSKDESLSSLTVTANILSNNTTSGLAFNDQAFVNEVLQGLEADKRILRAFVYSNDGKVFAEYSYKRTIEPDVNLQEKKSVFFDFFLPYEAKQLPHKELIPAVDSYLSKYFSREIIHPIILDGEVLGELHLEAYLVDLEYQLFNLSVIFLISFFIAVFFTYIFADRLQRGVTDPIIKLLENAKNALSSQKNSEKRKHENCDELSLLEILLEEIHKQTRELEDRNEYFNGMMRTLSEALIVIYPNGTVQLCNDTCVGLLGYDGEEIKGLPFKTLCRADDDWINMEDYRDFLGKGAVAKKDVELITKNGESIPVTLSGAPIFQADQVSGIIFLAYDLRGRKSMESQLVQAQKLEALGQLAAGVAHEINTPLQYIGDNTEFVNGGVVEILRYVAKLDELMDVIAKGDYNNEQLEVIVKEATAIKKEVDVDFLAEEMPLAISQTKDGVSHVVKIVQSLKAFAHPGGKDKELVDINKCIEDSVTLSRNEWKYVSDLETHLDETIPLIRCLKRELNQVILNIIVNAAHAIEDAKSEGGGKGRITITTRSVDDWAEIEVKDSGKGIPEEIINKVFDPFYTTKAVGKGTGQGLALAHKVITELCSGSITVKSKPGNTRFLIRLPMEEQFVPDKAEEALF
ncbi:MAG: PAS domain S-box-containing protein [Chlamydiales bacterium]|jgi:PAS domain S-box-containing protein